MKILIGILYSGEPQYARCKASIAAQSYGNWDLLEIHDQPNREAHQQLFDGFGAAAQEFDLFVKIDADMELCRSDFLDALVGYFEEHQNIEHLSIKVDDFFTARLIWGLNAFRSSVQFTRNDQVYTDKAVEVEPHARALLRRHPVLVPAALHAYDPTEYQAFYFGCHKAVKVMHRQSHSHFRNIQRLPWAGLLKRDHRHLIAHAGAALAFQHHLEPACLDRDDQTLPALFDEWKGESGRLRPGRLLANRRVISQARRQFLQRPSKAVG